MLGGLGWQELMIVLVIVLIIFGAGKLPQVAKSLGQGVKEFKTEAAGTDPAGVVAAAAGDVAPTAPSAELRAQEI